MYFRIYSWSKFSHNPGNNTAQVKRLKHQITVKHFLQAFFNFLKKLNFLWNFLERLISLWSLLGPKFDTISSGVLCSTFFKGRSEFHPCCSWWIWRHGRVKRHWFKRVWHKSWHWATICHQGLDWQLWSYTFALERGRGGYLNLCFHQNMWCSAATEGQESARTLNIGNILAKWCGVRRGAEAAFRVFYYGSPLLAISTWLVDRFS